MTDRLNPLTGSVDSRSWEHISQTCTIPGRSWALTLWQFTVGQQTVQAMMGVAQALGLNVIAEGVETEAQGAALIAAGCPMMQGYLFSRPLPAAEMGAYLAGVPLNTEDDVASCVEDVTSYAADIVSIGRTLEHDPGHVLKCGIK